MLAILLLTGIFILFLILLLIQAELLQIMSALKPSDSVNSTLVPIATTATCTKSQLNLFAY